MMAMMEPAAKIVGSVHGHLVYVSGVFQHLQIPERGLYDTEARKGSATMGQPNK
jgi:hypothetical protein